MTPIRFTCTVPLTVPRATLFAGIQDLATWPTFTGYGPLPGIRQAEYRTKTEAMTGSVIQVTNLDGSTHLETVTEWAPDRSIAMELGGFSPPLSKLATHFTERWSFADSSGHATVSREMQLYPRTRLARPALWLISLLLRRAIGRHLRQIASKQT